jgi:ribosome modulation factor
MIKGISRMETTPYDEGFAAFNIGTCESENPYKAIDNYESFQSWLGGWLSGLNGIERLN